MKNNLSRILIETILVETCRDIQENPERGIRNLIDKAVQFSGGRFQKSFFSVAQRMLQNENSSYYQLVREVIQNCDLERIRKFGMNLGYNACTLGAKEIRKNEVQMNCNIPWTIICTIDEKIYKEKSETYQRLIEQGEALGIYSWMIFMHGNMSSILDLIKRNKNSVFFLFCDKHSVCEDVLEELETLYNAMIVFHFDDSFNELCEKAKKNRILYAAWLQFGTKDKEDLQSGDLYYDIQEKSPLFTVLVPQLNLSLDFKDEIYESLKKFRKKQVFHTILYDLFEDTFCIDSIISDDTFSVYFDKNGNLYKDNEFVVSGIHNFFEDTLADIFQYSCAKEVNQNRGYHE